MAVIINKNKVQKQPAPQENTEKKIDVLFKDGETYDLEKITTDKERNGKTAITIGVDTESADGSISIKSKKEKQRITVDDCKRILFDE